MKKKLLLGLLLLLILPSVLFFVACNPNNNNNNPPSDDVEVQSISLSTQSISLTVGDSYSLSVSIFPSNATNKTITWSSSDSSVVTVSNGQLVAIKQGAINIYAKSSNGKIATCYVFVAENTSANTQFEFELYGNGYALVKYTGTNTIVEVPTTYNGKSVIAIGTGNQDNYNGFYKSYDIEKVILPETIKEINYAAFAYCSSLKEIEIPSCKIIGDYAFAECPNLISITIPSNCVTLGNTLFQSCNKLVDVTINGGTITSLTFSYCTTIEQLKIGDNAIITENSFKNLVNLKNLYVPNLSISITDMLGYERYYTCVKDFAYPKDVVGRQYNYNGTRYIYQVPANGTAWSGNVQWVKIGQKDALYMGEEMEVSSWVTYNHYLTIGTLSLKVDSYNVPNYAYIKCCYVPKSLENVYVTNQNIDINTLDTQNLPFNVIIGSKLEYELNGGTNSEHNPTCYSKFKSVTLENPTKKGYTFVGWTGSNGTTPQKNIVIPVGVVGDKKYIANWEIDNYSITYNLDGGEVVGQNPNDFNILSDDISIINPTKKGYKFVGWTGTNLNESTTELTISKGSVDSRIYTANWEIIKYSITYDSSWIGDNLNNPITYTVEDEIVLKNPSSQVINFIGWKLNNEHITKIQKGTTGDLTIYEDWGLNNELIYSITDTECKVVGVKDKTIKNIEVPEFVTEISKGAFWKCNNLESITLPFVGEKADGSGVAYFGYVFGALHYYENGDYMSESLKSVKLLNTVTEIKSGAFSYCSSLTNIDFSGCTNLTTIGSGAFSSCTRLINIDFSDCKNLITIGADAFYNCSSLTKVNISNIEEWLKIDFESTNANPLTYAKNLYINNELITNLVVPSNITEIKYGAFYNCSSLTNIDFSGCTNLTTIGSYAFRGCGLDSIDLSNCTSLTAIGDSVFSNCKDLTSITLPSTITIIGRYSFSNCINLKSIDLLNCTNLTSIGESAFSGCGLGSIDLSNCTSLKTIGDSAFKSCASLIKVIMPNCLSCIGSSAFAGCKVLQSITLPFIGRTPYCSGTNTDFEYVFGSIVQQSLKFLTLLNSITVIGDSAFSSCKELVSVDLSSCTSLTSIGEKAFYNCNKLVHIKYNSNSPAFKSLIPTYSTFGLSYENLDMEIKSQSEKFINDIKYDDNYLYYHTQANKYLMGFINECKSEIKDVEKNITYIYPKAFEKCYILTSIDLSNCTSLTTIGDYTFHFCEELTSVNLSNCTSLTTIGDYTFDYCEELISVNLSNCTSLKNLGDSSFGQCIRLTNIGLSECTSLTTIGNYAFRENRSLKNIYLSNIISLTTISDGAFYNCISLRNIGLSNCTSLKTIGDSAFDDCAFTNIDLSGCTSLKTIGDSAFWSCGNLTSIDLSKCTSLTNIGKDAFEYCDNLSNVWISSIEQWLNINFVNYLSNPLYYAKKLNQKNVLNPITKLVIPSSVTEIKAYAFYNCESIISINFSNCIKLTTIGESAFSNCTSLANIDLSNCTNLTTIGNCAFYNCDNLTSVNLSSCSNLTTIGNAFCECNSLTSVDLSDCTKLITIGNSAFSRCDKLISVDLTNCASLTTIGNQAFYNCDSLSNIDLSNCASLTTIGNQAFYNCDKLSEIFLPKNSNIALGSDWKPSNTTVVYK